MVRHMRHHESRKSIHKQISCASRAHRSIAHGFCLGHIFSQYKDIDGKRRFHPVEMYVYRFLAAYLILLLFTFRNILSKSWRDELTFLLCGVCAGSLYFITENYALRLTTAGNVSLLASISPIFTTILVAVMYRQKILPGVMIGSIVSFVGAGCIIFSHGGSLEFNPAGDLLALSAALSWAIYTMAIKR